MFSGKSTKHKSTKHKAIKSKAKRNIVVPAIIIMAAAVLTGCVNLLEDHVESITVHQAAPYERPPTEQITVSDYDEFLATILGFIMEQETNVQLLYYHNDGEDVQAQLLRAAGEIMNENPIGAFTVANITADATIIVSYYEVDIEIEYKRTQEQLDSIINVSSERYMRTQLLNIMSEYREEAVIRTPLQITEDDIAEFVSETYYQNPRRIIMLPKVTVEIFPEEGFDRIYEINFGYTDSPGMLQRFGEDLTLYVLRNAELAVGETDSLILLYLANNLIESTTFDEGTARMIQVHGAQNFAATAFGALVRGSAVGEGFAMAFKALCDELGLECRVVLGFYEDRFHAWNIVSLYGHYYHIDVAMSAVNGLEAGFLKTDADFEEMYVWDRENTVRCEGILTLEDIIGPEDPGDPEENGDLDEEPNEGEE